MEGGTGFDVAVIGAGAVGLSIAARIARDDRSVLVLEAGPQIAGGITSRNSEVIHAGIYYPADSLKARLCVEGRGRLYDWCAARRVGHRRLGKLIVATEVAEEPILEDLLGRARANGVDSLELIDRARIESLEPNVRARAALHSPETGIVDGHGLCLSLLADAESKGAVLALRRRVESLVPRSYGWTVETLAASGEGESLDAGVVIDAAGLAADRVATMAGLDIEALGWRQHLCKGDYFALGPGVHARPERLIYPVPQRAGLGIHATLDLTGRLRFGPDVEYIEEPDYRIDPAKAEHFRSAASRYLPGLADAEFVPDYAGIRPKLAGPGEGFRDFVVEETTARGVAAFVACLGIESPGLTASLAIAEYVEDLLG